MLAVMDVANRVNMAFADANQTFSFATEATVGQVRSLVSEFFAQWSTTQLVVTFVMLCVAYDQSEPENLAIRRRPKLIW